MAELPGLGPQDRETVQRLLSSPLDLPQEIKSWLVSYLEANPPSLHLAQMHGYSTLIDRIAALEARVTDLEP